MGSTAKRGRPILGAEEMTTTLNILSVSLEDRTLLVEWNGDPKLRFACHVPVHFERARMPVDFLVRGLAQACYDRLIGVEEDTPNDWQDLRDYVGRDLDATSAMEDLRRERQRLSRQCGLAATPITLGLV